MKKRVKTPSDGAGQDRPPRKLVGIAVNPEMRGHGPRPGAINAGRPRDEWKQWLRSLVDSDATRNAIEAILSDPTHPAFARVLHWADERGYGKEALPLEGGMTLTVVRRHEGINDRAG